MPNVYRNCPTCGTSMKLFLTGNRNDAEGKADWMIGNGLQCDDCAQKAREEKNAKAASDNAAAGLPALQGTEKQIAWAETIRANVLVEMDKVKSLLTLPADEMMSAYKSVKGTAVATAMLDFSRTMRADTPDKVAPLAQKFFALLRAQVKASFWIEGRSATQDYFFRQLKDEVLVSEEEKALEADVMAEATVQPKSPITHTVATVTTDKARVLVKFPEKRDRFREVVKGIGYRWDSNARAWALRVNATRGSTEDRAAELMHKLLSNGFIVCCLDERVRDKALNARFEPLYPRWVTITDRWQDCIAIEWSDYADFGNELKHFPTAKNDFYNEQRWYIRATEYASILDFAETNGFRLTPNAEALLMEAKAAEEKHLLAQDLPDASKAKAKGKTQDRTISGEIADELRDED